MPLTLGSVPETLQVTMVGGADFVSTLRRKDGSAWPAGSQLILEFVVAPSTSNPNPTNVEWTATFNGATASWNVDQADVDSLLTKKLRGVKLWYVEGDLRLLWAQGEIEVHGGL